MPPNPLPAAPPASPIAAGLVRRSLGRAPMRAALLATLLCAALVLPYVAWQSRQDATVALSRHVAISARLIREQARPLLRSNDRDALQRLLYGQADDTRLLYIAVYAPGGALLLSSEPRGVAAPMRAIWHAEPHLWQQGDRLLYTVACDDTHGLAMAYAVDEIDADQQRLLVRSLLLALTGLGVAMGATLLLTRGLQLRLRQVTERLHWVATGNLRAALKHTPIATVADAPAADPERFAVSAPDDMAQIEALVSTIAAREHDLMRRLSGLSQSMQRAARELAQGGRHDEHEASQQSHTIQESRGVLNALLQASRDIQQNTDLVVQNAEHAQNNNEIIAERLASLNAQLGRITEILDVIKDIANKTELLALNAALEGTKAGESGRSFSLVASQMQRLAESVMGAVHEIKAISADVTSASSGSLQASEEGARLAANTTRSARRIEAVIKQQRDGARDVADVIENTAQVAQQTRVTRRRSVRSTKVLSDVSQELENLTARFAVHSDMGDPGVS